MSRASFSSTGMDTPNDTDTTWNDGIWTPVPERKKRSKKKFSDAKDSEPAGTSTKDKLGVVFNETEREKTDKDFMFVNGINRGLERLASDLDEEHRRRIEAFKAEMENLASERHGNKQKGFTEAQPTRASSSSITSSSSTLFGRPSTNNKSGFSEKEGLGHSFAAVADAPSTTPTPVKGSVPCPGKIFAITDANSKHALALLDGELKFVEYSHKNQMRGGCWLWNCVEQNGWLGFRNVASGTYLGHDGKGVLTAVKKHHKSYEQLCVRQDPEERGYIFLMAVWDKLGKVGMVGSGQNATWRMAVDVTKPMVWKFVKV